MALVYHKELPFETQIALWKVAESIEDLKSRLMLNQEELDFYNSLQKGKRNLHWLASRVLIRKLLNTEKFIEVLSNEYGKPVLGNFDYHLSISHSFDFAAVIISRRKVGIDIELIKEKIDYIAHKFVSDEEFENLDENNKTEQLYVIWGGKESLFKLYGKGQLNFRNHIFFEPFFYVDKGWARASIIKDNYRKSFCIFYEKVEDYMLTYVIDDYDPLGPEFADL